MNLSKLAHVAVLGLVLAVAVSGCKKRPTPLTVLPGSRAGAPMEPGPGTMLDPGRTGGLENGGLTGMNVPGGTQGTTGFPMGSSRRVEPERRDLQGLHGAFRFRQLAPGGSVRRLLVRTI